MNVKIIKQYSVFMPNRPGALSSLTEHFGEAGINIVGITSEVRDDSALVCMALEGDQNHSAVLSKAGYASVEGKLISVEVEEGPGALGKITRLLGEGGINITTVYGTSVGAGHARVLIAVEDTDSALEILKKA